MRVLPCSCTGVQMTDLPCIQLLVCQQAEVVCLCPTPGVPLQAFELLAAAALQCHQPCADSIRQHT